MPVPSAITDLSQTAASNSPAGSESPITTDDYIRAGFAFLAGLRDGKGLSAEVDVASAATTDIGAANSFLIRITGTTTITSFGTTYSGPRFIRFGGVLTLTHNSTTLILPGGANITTVAGDSCVVTPISGGWVVSQYQRTSAPGGQLIGIQTFTSTAVYTPAAGTSSVIVEVQAPGGGSGGCVATTAGQWAAGRSGAGGGYGRKRITSAFSGVTVTIGAAGTAGAAGDNGGGTGGTTSFGALVSCTGGAGGGGSGAVQTAAGVTIGTVAAGGTATGADLSIPGSPPSSHPIAVSTSIVITGSGGAGRFGPGGAFQVVSTNNGGGATPSGYGGGASGPVNANSTFSAAAGAAGAPGIVVVYEYA